MATHPGKYCRTCAHDADGPAAICTPCLDPGHGYNPAGLSLPNYEPVTCASCELRVDDPSLPSCTRIDCPHAERIAA